MEGSANMIGYGLAAIGPGVGIGLIFAAYINGVARQPEARGALMGTAWIGFAVVEALAIIGIALAFVGASLVLLVVLAAEQIEAEGEWLALRPDHMVVLDGAGVASDAQITGATSSYARKYALNGMYNIDDTKDADTNEYRQQATQKANQAVKQQATGFNPQECLSKFVNLASSADMETLQSSFKQVWTSLKGYPEQSKAKEVYDLRKSELENSQEQING